MFKPPEGTIFYTGDEPDKLIESIYERNTSGAEHSTFIDGIFYCHRDDITEKTINIFFCCL